MMNQVWPSCYMQHLVFAIRKVSGLDVEGDKSFGIRVGASAARDIDFGFRLEFWLRVRDFDLNMTCILFAPYVFAPTIR